MKKLFCASLLFLVAFCVSQVHGAWFSFTSGARNLSLYHGYLFNDYAMILVETEALFEPTEALELSVSPYVTFPRDLSIEYREGGVTYILKADNEKRISWEIGSLFVIYEKNKETNVGFVFTGESKFRTELMFIKTGCLASLMFDRGDLNGYGIKLGIGKEFSIMGRDADVMEFGVNVVYNSGFFGEDDFSWIFFTEWSWKVKKRVLGVKPKLFAAWAFWKGTNRFMVGLNLTLGGK